MKKVIILFLLLTERSFFCSEAAKSSKDSVDLRQLILDINQAVKDNNINLITEIVLKLPEYKFKTLVNYIVERNKESIIDDLLKVPDIDLKYFLASAIAYNNPSLVIKIIEHPNFKSISDKDLVNLVEFSSLKGGSHIASLLEKTLGKAKMNDINSKIKEIEASKENHLPYIKESSDIETFQDLLQKAADSNDEESIQILLKNKNMTNSDILKDLSDTFSRAINDNNVKLIKFILNNPSLKKILDVYGSGSKHFIDQAIEKNNSEIISILVKNIKMNSYFYRIYSIEIFESLIEKNNLKVIKILLTNNNFFTIWVSWYEHFFIKAIQKKSEKIVEYMLKKNNIFSRICEDVQSVHCIKKHPFLLYYKTLDEALKIAQKNKSTGCANWIMAYTALKPEAELIDLNLFEKHLVQAYQQMLDGDANDLRNLVLPMGKSKSKDNPDIRNYIFPIFLQTELVTPAYMNIKEAVYKVFKEEHVKPLLLSLPEYQWQKEAALDMLKSWRPIHIDEPQETVGSSKKN